jgi:hypothetical protein
VNKIIIYPEGDGIAVMRPVEAARGTVLVSAAVYSDPPEPPEPEPGMPPAPPSIPVLLTPEVTRPETDDEFVMRIALKDVPTGVPFRIITEADLPSDYTTRALWQADFTTHDGVGA